MTHLNASDWSLHSSCVIGYTAQCCINGLSLAQCQPANADLNLAANDRRTERSNHACVIVLNIENIKGYFLSFGSCLQNPLGSQI